MCLTLDIIEYNNNLKGFLLNIMLGIWSMGLPTFSLRGLL